MIYACCCNVLHMNMFRWNAALVLSSRKTARRTQVGFTLIELLVVIAIIGLLASVVLVSLNSARAKSRDAKRLSDIRQFANALEMYYNDNPSVGYPSTLGPLVPSYMSTVPPYPLPNDNSCPSTATAGAYGLNYVGSQGGYTLAFCLGAQTGGYAAGTRTLSNQGVK